MLPQFKDESDALSIIDAGTYKGEVLKVDEMSSKFNGRPQIRFDILIKEPKVDGKVVTDRDCVKSVYVYSDVIYVPKGKSKLARFVDCFGGDLIKDPEAYIGMVGEFDVIPGKKENGDKVSKIDLS